MNVVTIASIAVLATVVLALILAFPIVILSRMVSEQAEAADRDQKGYNPRATLGHRILAEATTEAQMREARLLAARTAAAQPRGGNFGIGRLGDKQALRTASKGLNQDPISAVKIAEFHTWRGATTGPVASDAVASPAAAGAPAGAIQLPPEPTYTKITDDMDPADARKARISNSKARSAYNKQLKAMGIDPKTKQPIGGAAPVVTAAAAVTVGAPAPPAVDLPPEPDYVEINDDMDPADARKARIGNSKARSAYNKQLKAMGIDPKTKLPIGGAPAAAAVAVPAAPAAVPAAAPPAMTSADLPPAPEYIDITDDMDPADARKARITNSKARSAYSKQLKAMGIDPKSVVG